ncbi:hypothetical protein [Burkholderia gladioli]|uniref:hypothetical protein n=1 Tax=Burkholderia gladioli TaxID=28095 RepID=UPI0005C57156|nr:hypothetical protein [Burkholderia gladioli]
MNAQTNAIDISSHAKKAVVLYSERDGVYLGSCLGLGFWSKLDPAGQTHAFTFPGEAEARAAMETWDTLPGDVRLVEVAPDQAGYASMAACIAAGLPGWNPDVPCDADGAVMQRSYIVTGCIPGGESVARTIEATSHEDAERQFRAYMMAELDPVSAQETLDHHGCYCRVTDVRERTVADGATVLH